MSTSWFKYEELIEDWPDLTVLETSKRGPALKNRLHGSAAKHKPLLSREALRAEDGVEYFGDKLRPHFVKGAYSVFLWILYLFIRARRGHTANGRLDWKILFASEACERFLDGHVTFVVHDGTAKRESIPGRHDSIKCRKTGRNQAALDPSQQATRDNWYATHVATHGSLFPFSDNLTTLIFIVASDLDEAQRERVTCSLSLRNITVIAYTLDAVETVFVELFCTPRSSMENPSPQKRIRQQ